VCLLAFGSLFDSLGLHTRMFESHVTWLRLLVVCGYSVANLIEKHVQAFNANQLELEAPVALT